MAGNDPFFQSSKKRKRPAASTSKEPHRPAPYGKGQKQSSSSSSRKPSRKARDESISGGEGADDSSDAGGPGDLEDIDFREGRLNPGEWDSEEEAEKEETAGEKRIRLARKYLGKVREEITGQENGDSSGHFFDAEEIDKELIAGRLKLDVDLASSRIHTFLASSLLKALDSNKKEEEVKKLFVPALNGRSPTGAVLCPSNGELFVGDKGGWIGWWSLEKREEAVQPVVEENGAGDEDEEAETSILIEGTGTETTQPNGKGKGKGKASSSPTHLITKPFGQHSKTPLPSIPTSKTSKSKGDSKTNSNDSKPTTGGHKGPILCLSVSEDGRYLVSGGKDKLIGVWELSGGKGKGKGKKVGNEVEERRRVKWLKSLGGHKDAVTSLIIPPLSNPSHHLLTTSLSRSLTLHSLSTLSQIDTFFGHQDSITSVSALSPLSCVTAGSRDRTVRWWKVEEEVQLVFRGGGRTVEGGKKGKVVEKEGEGDEDEEMAPVAVKNKKVEVAGKKKDFWEGSVDCVCMLDDQHFLSGGDSGSISLWHTGKKKPIFTQSLAHGTDETHSESEGLIVGARWITSLAALRGTDLFASGSWSGDIKLWKLDRTLKNFSPLHDIPALGFVNSLQLTAVNAGIIDSNQWNKEKASTIEDAPEDVDVDMQSEVAAPVATRSRAKPDPDYLLVAALSKEPRLGRWMDVKSVKGVKNGTLIVHLKRET